MGVTVTTNLGLIKPDGNEYIKEDLPTFPGWAAQNADNCDAIDALFRTTTHTYTPTLTSDNINPTLGAGGFADGKYLRLFPRMVFAYFRIFTGGAGFATGTGIYRLSIPPVAMAPEITGMQGESVLGRAYLHDDSAVATSTICTVMYDHGVGVLNFRRHDGSYWNNNTPFTLAQNDRLSGYIMYPTTAA